MFQLVHVLSFDWRSICSSSFAMLRCEVAIDQTINIYLSHDFFLAPTQFVTDVNLYHLHCMTKIYNKTKIE